MRRLDSDNSRTRGGISMKRNPDTIAIGNIGLNVSDLDISEAFYQEVFGLVVAEESLQPHFRYASMARGGKTVLMLWERRGGDAERCLQGLHHLSFEADSLEEVN